ncbi:FAD-dependent oxidoreductase [Ruminiclostridium cellobioparum]|nr:FAD-dependent oxidoreductase [Ruminiclostridium cellobioparum]
MNICMAMGQAVGTGAALAAETGVTPRRLNYKLIQEELTLLGVKLFD